MNYNNKQLSFNENQKPYLEYGRVMIPVRYIAEQMNYTVNYSTKIVLNSKNEEYKQEIITITNGVDTVEMYCNSNADAYLNGKKIVIDDRYPDGHCAIAARKLGPDTYYVPIRFINECLGAKVEFKTTNGIGTVNITK